MRKIEFLIKIHNEGKLDIVEPSQSVADSYEQKSDSHLESARILFEKEKLEESISMAYYGMYHPLLSLLFKCGIKSENHSVSILLLKELFNRASLAKEISFSKKERIDKQYYTDFKIASSDCEDMIKKAEGFIIECKSIKKRLNEEKILKLRKELQEALK